MKRPASSRVLPVVLLLFLGCEGSGTGGEAVALQIAVETERGEDGGPLRSFDVDGWDVTLERAELTLGPLYLFETEGPIGGTARLLRGLQGLVLPMAHAHPGHDFFYGGQVLAALEEPFVYDALAKSGREELGWQPGIAGRARTFSLYLAPPALNGGQAIAGPHAFLEATAVRGDERVSFAIAVTFPDTSDQRRVDFVPVDLEVREGGTFVLEVRPSTWLRGADLERLLALAGEEGERLVVPPAHQVHRAVYLNLRTQAAFGGRWE